MPNSEQAAVAAAEAIIAEGVEGEETPSGSEETPVEFPSFEVELPADLVALLEEDDEEPDTTEAEVDALAEEHEDVPRDVLERMLKAEKRAKHLESLRVNDAKKNWSVEAAKFFPFSEPFLSEINATSRRGFLSTAKQVHDKIAPEVEKKVLGPAREAIEAAKAKAIEEGKEEAKKAWGEPGERGGETPSEASVTLQNVERRRATGDFSDTVRNMLFPKKKED